MSAGARALRSSPAEAGRVSSGEPGPKATGAASSPRDAGDYDVKLIGATFAGVDNFPRCDAAAAVIGDAVADALTAPIIEGTGTLGG